MQNKHESFGIGPFSGLELDLLTHLKETVNLSIRELAVKYKDTPSEDSLDRLISNAYEKDPIVSFSRLNIEKHIYPILTDGDMNTALFELHTILFSSLPLGEPNYFNALINQIVLPISFSIGYKEGGIARKEEEDNPFTTVYANFDEVKKTLMELPLLITYLCISLYFKPHLIKLS